MERNTDRQTMNRGHFANEISIVVRLKISGRKMAVINFQCLPEETLTKNVGSNHRPFADNKVKRCTKRVKTALKLLSSESIAQCN